MPSVKGSQDPSHFIFEINVGKGRIRHKTTLNLNIKYFRTEKLHEQRTVNRKLRLFYQHQLATESNNRNAVEEEIKLLRKNLEIEKSKQISTLPDSEITKTLEEHYKEKLDKLADENEQLKKRYTSYGMTSMKP